MKKLPKKLIVCLRAPANHGKTNSIFALARELVKNTSDCKNAYWISPPEWNDSDSWTPSNGWDSVKDDLPNCITLKVRVGDKIIGLDSEGDEARPLQKRLKKLADISANNTNNPNKPTAPCDIIFCTCRTKSETPRVVENMKRYGYSVIWTSPYTIWEDGLHDLPNQMKARHLLDFIKQ